MNKATLATFCHFLERMKDRIDSDAEAEVAKLKSQNAKLEEELGLLRGLQGPQPSDGTGWSMDYSEMEYSGMSLAG